MKNNPSADYVDALVDFAIRFGRYTPERAARLRADTENDLRILRDAFKRDKEA